MMKKNLSIYPEKEGAYLCRLNNGFICMVYYKEGKWIEMWGTKELNVVKFIPIPPEIKK